VKVNPAFKCLHTTRDVRSGPRPESGGWRPPAHVCWRNSERPAPLACHSSSGTPALPTSPLLPRSTHHGSNPCHHCLSPRQTAMLTQPDAGVQAQAAPALIRLSAAPRTPGCASRQCQHRLPLAECTLFFPYPLKSRVVPRQQTLRRFPKRCRKLAAAPSPQSLPRSPSSLIRPAPLDFPRRGYSTHVSWSCMASSPKAESKEH